ncbi:TMV resistance protein N-like [Dorcoceras hygrometricum]|uniref:TMV resistance protein N-like n=1 Tax=Dorcoceras hygrometricum TaxID=472368 RepID=A0A2Z7CX19_9LAMI|nr:TMV resistance protein N-like [Dorcoceras hygrometricum]
MHEKKTGIDQLNLHSVQLGYLKILQMGNTDPNNTKQENKYEVKPQYEELSKQLIMQHAIIDSMKSMRAIKDRIARPVYYLEIISVKHLYHAQPISRWKSSVHDIGARTTHQSTSHNVAFHRIINQSVRLNMYA